MSNDRRGFLKAAGTGFAAGALVSQRQIAIAQSSPGPQRQATFLVVSGADFRFLKVPRVENNTFVLNNVSDFSVFSQQTST
jgi:hypothetical protein